MANGINQLTMSTGQQFQTQRATSGYGTPSAGPFSNSFSQSVTSGQVFSDQRSLASGASVQYDLVSGSLTDLQGNPIQMTTFHGFSILAASGAVAARVTQSGGLTNWPFLSGGGAFVPPGGNLFFSEQIASGFGFTPAAGVGNINFLACSGAALLTWGIAGR